jgi:hypothetical protein
LFDFANDFQFTNQRVTIKKDSYVTYLRHENLSPSVINTTLQMSSLDMKLYEKVQHFFPYEMWDFS